MVQFLYTVYSSAGNVDYLKKVGRLVYNLFRWRRRRAASGNPASASAPPPNAEAEGSAESVDGGNQVPRAASGSSLNAAASGSGQGFANNTGVRNFTTSLFYPLFHSLPLLSLSLTLSPPPYSLNSIQCHRPPLNLLGGPSC